jgi:hypothetical protein
MRFMAFVKSTPETEAGALPDEKALSEMGAYNDRLIAAGAMLAGEGLKPSAEGGRVRIAAGKTSRIDGPFAEAKELVGGYWILQLGSREEAIEWLRRAPFREGEVELRPLYEASDFGLPEDALPPPPEAVPPARIPGTTRYLSLLKADAYTEARCAATPELLAEMGALMEEMTKRGVLLMGEGLKPSREGARIAYGGKQARVVDGPFTETKELIAGVSLLQTRTLAEALEWSRRCLDIHMRGVGAGEGEIEVRPLFELEDFPVDAAEQPDGWRAREQAFRDRAEGR